MAYMIPMSAEFRASFGEKKGGQANSGSPIRTTNIPIFQKIVYGCLYIRI